MRFTLLTAAIITAFTASAAPTFSPANAAAIQKPADSAADGALDSLPAADEEERQTAALSNLKLEAIDIRGIKDSEQRKNAEVFLGLEKVKGETISQPAYVNYLIENGADEIKRSQQPFGYYNASVKTERKVQNGKLTVIYTVNLGSPTTIRTIDVQVTGTAQQDPQFQKLLADNPFRQGETLSHEQYEDYKDRFLALAVARGYFDGVFTQKVIAVDPGSNTADITLHYDSGERYMFNKVVFVRSAIGIDGKPDPNAASEPLPLDEDLLQRFVQFQSGQPYTAEQVAQLQADLQGSGYFKQVLVGGSPNRSSKDVPVEAQLTMNKNKSYIFGIGYSTDSGVRGKFDFDWRWVNSRGHTFSSSLYASQKDSSLDMMYRIPAKNPTTDYYYIRSGGWIRTDDYDSRRAFLEGGYNWRKKNWEYRVSATTAWEKFTIGNDSGATWLTYPTLQATYSSTQNRLNPESGFQARINLKGGAKGMGSDLSFLQTNLKFRYVQSLGQKNRLLMRFDGGADNTSSFHQLPPSLRYFAGGDRSIRGYAYEKIGPRDSSGDNIGGKYLAVGSLEYEYYFKPDWAAAAFVDAGDAWTSSYNTKLGAGVGVHWHSPVGPIKIDFGHGFNEEYGDKIRLHLTIGAELDL